MRRSGGNKSIDGQLEAKPEGAERDDYVNNSGQVILPLKQNSGGSFRIYWCVIIMANTPALGKLVYATV